MSNNIDTNTGNNEAAKNDPSSILKHIPSEESIQYALDTLKRLAGVFSIFEFIDRVEAMMDQQQKFFKTRSRDDLVASKKLEKEVRELILKFKEPQTKLF